MKQTRKFLTAILMLVAASAAAQPRAWQFDVFLDDSAIGEHRFELRPRESDSLLVSEATFEVRALFIPLYRYRHQSTEVWEQGCLQRINASTDDNGDRLSVQGALNGSRFVLSSPDTDVELPQCVKTFAYWDPAFLKETSLLNPQTGEYVPVQVRRAGREPVVIDGRTVPADRYELEAGDLRITLWYGADGDWLGLESLTPKQRTIRYVRQLPSETTIARLGQ